MAEARSIRGFLRKHRKQQQRTDDGEASRSVTSSLTSQSGDVAMEGPLKKRVAKMPVMHDRYCVATWELDAAEHKCALLRSYKSRKAYDAHPERPSSVHELKCISDWDGRTGFHRYQHAFTMETRDQKLFQCVAPSAADKDKWLELLAVHTAFHSGRDMRLNSVGSLVPLRRTQSVESRKRSDANATDSDGPDGLFRTTSGASTNSLELPDKNEPADWGLYGGEAKATYEEQDDAKQPVLLLDKELLDAKTLATDAYLFEEGRASRFGAVVVPKAAPSDEDEDDFVDEQFEAREAHKMQEKSMRRRAQKLESNRDLYAEMAAARLAGMRKDARHPRKSHSRPSDESDAEEEQDEDEPFAVEGETKESAAEREAEDVVHERHSRHSHRSSKSHKKSFVSSSENTNSVAGGYVSGDDEEEEEVEVAAPADVTEAEREEAEELRQLKKQHRAERRAKKRLLKEKEEEERAALQAAELARAHREEQRAREEAKAREEQEKRDKKERREMKEKLKREKAKQRQAEAELRKLVELKQAEEERRERERKEKKEKKEKKKSKKKEKYTSPADRIQKKEERAAERAAESAAAAVAEAEVSNALVVVEKTAEPEPAPQPRTAPEPAPTPASTSTSSSVQTEATPTEQVAAPASVPVVPGAAPAPAPVPAPVEGAAASAHTMPMPMYQVAPPPFVPMYPPGPQSMPAYGLAATFGAYPPQLYPTPYSYGVPVGPQPTYMRPNMGFMAGLSAMGSFGKTAGPEPTPSSQDYAEPMIGPQLPTAEDRTVASSAGASAPPPPPPSADKTSAKLMNLPELPDVVEF